MRMSPIILIQLLGNPELAHHRKKQYLWTLPKTSSLLFAYPRYGVTRKGRLEGYFWSDIVYNLSRKVLNDTEIWILD